MAKPKLCRADCESIRGMYADRNFRESSGTLARMFHVTPGVILKVLDNKYTPLEDYEEKMAQRRASRSTDEDEFSPEDQAFADGAPTAAELKAEEYEHPIFGPVIYAYTRAQAIEDGTLINLGMFVSRGRPVLDWVGIRFPVAMTSTAYHDVTGEGEGPELLNSELITQRVLYLLGRLKAAILKHTGDPTQLEFVCTNADIKPIHLKAVIGPGDTAEPVITVMLPGED